MNLLSNRYEVLRRIGLGTFGETFLARDHHLPSRRQCVIKRLRIETITPELMKPMKTLFEREAQTLETLGEGSNGRVPKLFANFMEDDQFYLVQEYIEGETLAARILRGGPMPEAEVVALLTELLRTLDYVHARRVIHRDIKPGNIILRSPNQQPVLIDYGIVRHQMTTALGQANASSLTFGTAGYVPIEQIQGRTVFASDLFALGRTAVFALTGVDPQHLTNLRTGNFEWRDRAPQVSEWLVAILDKAMRDHYGDRFTTAEDMLAALRPLTPTLPGTSPPALTIPNLAPTRPASVHATDYPVAPRPKLPILLRQKSVWRPLVVWFSCCGFIFLLLVAIRLFQVSGPEEARVDEAKAPSTSQATQSQPPPRTTPPASPPQKPVAETLPPASREASAPEPKASSGPARGTGGDPTGPARTSPPKTNPGTGVPPVTGTPGPEPAPTAQVVKPRVLYMPRPTYTADARMNQVSGKVVLSVEVLEDGSVGEIQVISGLGHGLDERAIATVRKARFAPATRDGKPFRTRVKIEVSFEIY